MVCSSANSVVAGTCDAQSCAPSERTPAAAPPGALASENQQERAPVWQEGPEGSDR